MIQLPKFVLADNTDFPNNLFVDTVQCWTIRCISYTYSSSILSPILYEISKQKIY